MLGVLVLALGLMTYSYVGQKQLEDEYPATGAFVEVSGVKLHYRVLGQGQPLVMLHGASGNLQDFASSLAPELLQEYQLILFDRPGHGYSERPAGEWLDPRQQAALLHQALAVLGVERPVMIGHSWSGALVLAYLLAYPETTAGGILISGASHPWQGGVSWTNHLSGTPLLGPVFHRTLLYPLGSLAMDKAIESVFSPNPVPEGYRDRIAAPLILRPQQFRFNAQDVRYLSQFLAQQSPSYAQIELPVLLVTGDQDGVVPAWNHSDRLIKQLSKGQLHYISGAGHAPHHSHTQAVVGLIRDFIQQQITQ